MKQTVFIVEDDQTIAQVISDKLTSWGLECVCVTDFQNVSEQCLALAPQLVLMDISLPYFNGFHWCQEIRKQSNVPLIFISSASDQMNQIMAMNLGADDFIVKPFELELLNAKVQALLRRSYEYVNEINENNYTFAKTQFDLEKNTLTNQQGAVELTPTEAKIFLVLVKAKGQLVPKSQIVEALWQDDSFIDNNTLAVNLTRIRKKLAQLGLTELIKTVKGKGYILEESGSDQLPL